MVYVVRSEALSSAFAATIAWSITITTEDQWLVFVFREEAFVEATDVYFVERTLLELQCTLA